MSIIVTGSAGFIAHHLAKHIGEHRGIDSAHGEDAFIASENGAKADTVYHLAAASSVQATPDDQLHDTFESTYWATEMARERLIFASSGAVYGHGKLPVSVYGACKLGAEGLVSAWGERTGKRWSVLRLNNVVGRGCHGVIPDILRKLRKDPRRLEVLGDGSAMKWFTHVDDLIPILADPPDGLQDVRAVDHPTKIGDVIRWCCEVACADPVITWGKWRGGWPGDMPDPDTRLGVRCVTRSSDAAAKQAIIDVAQEVFG